MLVHKSSLRNHSLNLTYLWGGLGALLVVSLVSLLAINLFASHDTTTTPSLSATTVVSSEVGYQNYHNSRYAYSISYPQGWQVISQGDSAFTATSAAPDATAGQGGTNYSQRKLLEGTDDQAATQPLSKVDVLAFDLNSEMTAAEFMQDRSASTPEGQVTTIKLGNYEAIKVQTQSAALPNHTDALTYTSVFVAVGKHGYIIAGVATPALFDHILGSFQA